MNKEKDNINTDKTKEVEEPSEEILEDSVEHISDEDEDFGFFTLTDDEGNQFSVKVYGTVVLNGKKYYCLIPTDTDPNDDEISYDLFTKEKDENGDDFLMSIEDDEEYYRVADYFEDKIFEEIDYDTLPDNAKGDSKK